MNYEQYFIKGARTNGEPYLFLHQETPDELRDLVQSIHFDHFFGCLSNDWIYQIIYESLAFPDEEPEADIYNHELTQWLADWGNQFAIEYCNEAIEVMGCGVSDNIIGFISNGQLLAKQRIYDAVQEFINEHGESNDQ